MKGLLIGLLALGSISAFAGVLVNKDSRESIQFELDAQNLMLSITSRAAGVESRVIKLGKGSRKKSEINLFAATTGLTELIDGDYVGSYKDPLHWYIVIPATVAYDILLLPFKGTVKAVQNQVYKKDLNELMKAIVTTEEVDVSSNRFRRIVRLLK